MSTWPPGCREAARRAVGAVAKVLHRDLAETASAILDVAGETMITAILDITVAEGLDPRDCMLVAGGGAAGFNVVAIARELGGCTQRASAIS